MIETIWTKNNVLDSDSEKLRNYSHMNIFTVLCHLCHQNRKLARFSEQSREFARSKARALITLHTGQL
jgi:hypothetical protein